MATIMDHILSAVQKYFELGDASNRNEKIERCLIATKTWISSRREFTSVAETYKFVSMNILPLWNEVIGENIASPNIFMVHDVIFNVLLSSLPSCIKDTGWFKIRYKISLKYAGKLISAQKYTRAETCLDFAETEIQKLINGTSVVQETSTDSKENSTIVESKKDLLICYLYRIEIHFANENYMEAKKFLQISKVSLLGILDDVSWKYVTTLCFNIGLDAYQREKYEESVFWLTQSYEMSGSTTVNQDSTLLLLAEAHMMLDSKLHYEEAIVALNKVDCENKDFLTNLIKLKACIGSGASPDDIRKNILLCYKTVDLNEDKVLQVFIVLQCCNQKYLLHEAMLTFEGILSLSQVGKIFAMHLKMLLKEDLLIEADDVAKSFINALSRSVSTFESPLLEEMLNLVDSQANSFQEKSMFAKAVCWFDYCIQIANHVIGNEIGLRKLKFYQQKCSCVLELGLSNEAKEVLMLAEEQMAHHIINIYLRLKLCIIQNEESEAISIIESFELHPNNMDDSDDIAKILVLTAEFGLNKLRVKTTIHVLESVIAKLSNSTSMLTVLKCIIRLKLQSQCDFADKIDQEWIYEFLPKVYKCLNSIKDDKAMAANEAKWFMKIFWNIAHGEMENSLFVHRLLDCCSKILLLCDSNDTATLLLRSSCILISMTAGLEVLRSSFGTAPNPGLAQELITCLTKNILENINEFKNWNIKFNPQHLGRELLAEFLTMQRLLLICEFEVKAILHSHDLEDVFERAVSLPDITGKTFELLAAIAYRGGSFCYSLTVRSLRAAIGKLLEKPRDYDHLARLYHSLLCVVSTKMENNITYKADFGKFINEVYELIKLAPDGNFPQSELLWFITKTWNNSLKLYLKFGRHNEALAWSQLAIGMSDHLVCLKEVYQTKMKLLYDQMSQPLSRYSDAKKN